MTDPLPHSCRWVEQMVIGLNLCPFAAKPHKLGRVRYVLENSRKLSSSTAGYSTRRATS